MKCAVGICKQSNSKKTNVSFYNFPKDEARRKLWVTFCKRVKPVNVDKEKICALHFKKEDFERNLKFEMGFSKRRAKILKSHAVPSILTCAVKSEKKTADETEVTNAYEILGDAEIQVGSPITIKEEFIAENPPMPIDLEERGLQTYVKALEMEMDSLIKENCTLKREKSQCNFIIKKLSYRIQKLSFAKVGLEKALSRLFTEGQIKKLKSGDKRQNFTEADIAESITLYSASAKAYMLLRKKHFPLPSVRTLQRWSQKFDVSTVTEGANKRKRKINKITK